MFQPLTARPNNISGFFNTTFRKTRFSIGSHFQWLIAIENAPTSFCRTRRAWQQHFSTIFVLNTDEFDAVLEFVTGYS